MKLLEVLTQVRVLDRERPYFYWVSVAKPEKAIASALKRHRSTMGLIPGETDLTAEVVPTRPADVPS